MWSHMQAGCQLSVSDINQAIRQSCQIQQFWVNGTVWAINYARLVLSLMYRNTSINRAMSVPWEVFLLDSSFSYRDVPSQKVGIGATECIPIRREVQRMFSLAGHMCHNVMIGASIFHMNFIHPYRLSQRHTVQGLVEHLSLRYL